MEIEYGKPKNDLSNRSLETLLLQEVMLMFRCLILFVCAVSAVDAAEKKDAKEKEPERIRWVIEVPPENATFSIVQTEKDEQEILLGNGTAISTAEAFKKNVDVKLQWKYESKSEDKKLPEVFAIALRTDGRVKDGKPLNGIVAHIQTQLGIIDLIEYVNGEQQNVGISQFVSGSTKEAPKPIAENVWYDIHIRDTGGQIHLEAPALLGKEILHKIYKPRSANRVLLMSNREPKKGNCSSVRALIVEEITPSIASKKK